MCINCTMIFTCMKAFMQEKVCIHSPEISSNLERIMYPSVILPCFSQQSGLVWALLHTKATQTHTINLMMSPYKHGAGDGTFVFTRRPEVCLHIYTYLCVGVCMHVLLYMVQLGALSDQQSK